MARILSFGGGVNSTALLIGLVQKGNVPDHVLFADTGGEKPETYEHIDRMDRWLWDACVRRIVTVKHSETLEDDCLARETLPSKVFGFGSCSEHFKIRPQRRWLKEQGIVDAHWLVGIHADESRRAQRIGNQRDDVSFPLIDWGWGQEKCEAVIVEAGFQVPVKSACFFCPAMRKVEVLQLARTHPELFQRAVEMEQNAQGLEHIKGLGRRWSWEKLAAADQAQLRLFPDDQANICDSCVDW